MSDADITRSPFYRPCPDAARRFVAALLVGLALTGAVPAAKDDAAVAELITTWFARAERGDADALFNLGQLYRQGSGVDQDAAQAMRFYRAAAERGHAGAQFNLGTMHYFGSSGTPDLDSAERWWTAAAEQGHPVAQLQLGRLYLTGQRLDPERAVVWLRAAERQEVAAASQTLARLPPFYTAQVAALGEADAANALSERLAARLGPSSPVEAVRVVRAGALFKVQVGRFSERTRAEHWCARVTALGEACFVAKVSP